MCIPFTLRFAAIIFLVGTAFALASWPSIAGEGHDHGNESAPATSILAVPRGEANSSDLEIVAAATAGRLIIYLDRFGTNEPLTGASVEVIEGDQTSKAVEVNPGIYTVAGWSRPPGVVALTVAVDAADLSDLLAVTIEIPVPTDPAGLVIRPTLWIIIGQTATVALGGFLLLVFYARSRRRYDVFLESGARLSKTALLVSTQRADFIETVRARRIGPSLAAEPLWNEMGCDSAVSEAARHRRFNFPVERVIYANVVQRLFASGTIHSVTDWLQHYQVKGLPSVDESDVDIAMAWLAEEADATGRSVKAIIEERLFERRSGVGQGLDLVFFNTLPVTIEDKARITTEAQEPKAQQIALGVVIDANHRPICLEAWPGGALDIESLLPVIDRLRSRFDIRHVCLVADLSVTNSATIEALEKRGLQFIFGVREGEAKDLGAPLLTDARSLAAERGVRHGDVFTDLHVTEVLAPEHGDMRSRFILYSDLRDKMGDAEPSAKASQYILHTNSNLSPLEIVLRYHQLMTVQETFRANETIFALHALRGNSDAVLRGHLFCSFLALLMRRELEEKLAKADVSLAWRDLLNDLNSFTEVELRQDERRFLLRTRPQGCTAAALGAIGVTPPETVERYRENDDTLIEASTSGEAPWDRLRHTTLRVTEGAVIRAAQNLRAVGDWVGRHK